jgi:hypothetical protein
MAITHVASAAGATSNPTLTDAVTYSSSIVAGDIILVWVHNRYADQDVNLESVVDNDSAGNALAEHALSPSANLRLSLWWKIATSATASKVATATLDAEGAIIIGYSAYRSDAGGFDADSIVNLAFEANASGNETQAGFTPDAADSLIGLAVAPMNNVAVSSQGADAPDTLSERFDKASSAAEDHQLSYASGLQSGGPTATGTFTWAMTNAASDSAVHELKEAAGGATPATVTPGAIARSFAVNAVTAKGAAKTVPAATARSVAVNAPTVTGGAVTEPAATARSFGVNAVTVHGAAVTTPAQTARSFVIPQADAFDSGSLGLVEPAQIARTFAVNAPTLAGSAVTEPAQIARSALVNAVTAEGGAVTEPSTVARSFLVNAPAVHGAAVTEPAATARSFLVNEVTVDTGGEAGTVTPTVIARSFTLPAPIAKGLGKVVPAVISLTVLVRQALANLIHGPNPSTAPGNQGGSTAPTAFNSLGAELGSRGFSSAAGNTGRSTASGNSPDSDA